jgi:glyoxylase-like metal-dependent hydrolase (beta-lactamase superfamily II)
MVPNHISLVRADNPSPMTLEGTNTWVIRDQDTHIVIDPGPLSDPHLDRLVSETHGRVSTILLTHGHADHAEGAQRFAEMVGCGIRAIDPSFSHQSDALKDEEKITTASWTLKTLFTPGHTGDSATFLFDTDGASALLTGDTILGRGTTVIDLRTGRLRDYLASMDRLEGIAADRERSGTAVALLPGHGPTHSHVSPVIEFYIAHRRERLEQVRQLVAEGITDVDAIVESIYSDVPESVRAAAGWSVKAQMEYLRED